MEIRNAAQTKTLDGMRGLFVLLAMVFAGIACWLTFHEALLASQAALLLLIPVAFGLACALLAGLASDRTLKRVARFLLAS